MVCMDKNRVLPEYPRTRHLPWKPNTVRGDLVATEDEAKVLFNNRLTTVQEKVDGANCGMALYEGEPIIRSKDHILRKGYRKETPAKMQFASVWNWFYDHKDGFEALNNMLGPVAVYGEWMIQSHGMVYDWLPDWFIAHDIYDFEGRQFLDPLLAQAYFEQAGFHSVPILKVGDVESYEELEELANGRTDFAVNDKREGIYVRVSDGARVLHRFKMVREGFVQGGLFSEEMKRNKLAKV